MESVHIENQEIVIAQFEQWPAFHDAEIISVLVERGEPGFWPIVLLKIDVISGLNSATPTSARRGLIELQFTGVHDHEFTGFNH